MKVAWMNAVSDRSADICRAALRALGMRDGPASTDDLLDDARADVRVLHLSGMADRAALARELAADESPTLLLASTAAEEIEAQHMARLQDDVARVGDAPEGLMLRMHRLRERRRQYIEAHDAITRDSLTGLLNRRSFESHAQAVLEVLAPEARAGLLILDIDHFKRINDRHGHAIGDEVLKHVARSIGATLGTTTPVFRMGGEEFCWIAEATNFAELAGLADRVLAGVRALEPSSEGGVLLRLTASIGWTGLARGGTLQEAMQEADSALYDAKAKGRDRVQSWHDMHAQASAADSDVQLVHFQNVAKVVNERATHLVTLFGKGLVEKARLAADQDRLTQLWNRGYFDRRLARDVELSKRDGRPLALVMMDLDHFGQFNRNHGLPTGDAVLRQFAGVALAQIRVVDWMARYGGEEFALVLPGTLQDAALVAERIRQAVEATEIKTHRGDTVRVTVSIGVVVLDESMATPVDLVQRASDALRTAKRDGRNRVAA